MGPAGPAPALVGGSSRAPVSDDRRVLEGIIYRYRCGLAWRDVPSEFGPWQTLWKRHRRYSGDGTWDHVLAALLTDADTAGIVDWAVSVDSTIIRAHQHAATLARDTGGRIELHESARRARRSRLGSVSRRAVDEDPPARRWSRPAAGGPTRTGPRRGLTDVPAPDGASEHRASGPGTSPNPAGTTAR
ncbi:Mobile element protein [Pseudonocardia sp. Ae168_Ps1]|nr:Mobile element protein [Pseudonocardia sp. Ae150A_Ps1]OLL82458.1 Mobile element protein [Pseudonocardia sp. Ae168_Ps1]